jgi:hypothetical protein
MRDNSTVEQLPGNPVARMLLYPGVAPEGFSQVLTRHSREGSLPDLLLQPGLAKGVDVPINCMYRATAFPHSFTF